MSIGHWPFPAAILAEIHLGIRLALIRDGLGVSNRFPVSVIRLRIWLLYDYLGRHRMQFNHALQVKYCLRPPSPTTAIAIKARVEPESGTGAGGGELRAVSLPIRFTEAC
jgi:hypothetical protein